MASKNDIKIIYEIKGKKDEEDDEEEEENKDNINIFGEEFINNNKNICKMIIDNKESEIQSKFNIKNYDKDKLEIILKGIDKVTNMSYMFSGCNKLSSFESEWNTNNVTNMSHMFYGCSSLSSLPNISKWDTINVTNINEMFCDCKSLLSLPDFSEWNTKNIINMKSIFELCSSLTQLPDIG